MVMASANDSTNSFSDMSAYSGQERIAGYLSVQSSLAALNRIHFL